MRCDPISWKQSLFTASDRANLFLHQLREEGREEGGGNSPTLISGLSIPHVQYILGAEGIDLRLSLPHTNTRTLFHSHLFKCITFLSLSVSTHGQHDDVRPAI